MGVLWAIWPQRGGVGPVLSGFAHIGLSQAQIGFLTSFIGLFGLCIVGRSPAGCRQRRMCVALGLVEITAGGGSTALVPEGLRFYAMAAL